MMDGLLGYDWASQTKLTFGFAHDGIYAYYNLCQRYDTEPIQITGGEKHLFIMRDGSVRIGDIPYRKKFKEIRDLPKDVIKISSCHDYAYILRRNGTLMRSNTIYYDINNRFVVNFTGLSDVPADIIQIATGADHIVILQSDGTLWSRGDNTYGQLGLGNYESNTEFTEIKGLPKDIVKVVCGDYNTFVLRADGTLMGCGFNVGGQLGLSCLGYSKLLEIPDLPKDIVRISCGLFHTIIQRLDGTIMACGNNRYGQLGFGENDRYDKFTEIKDVPMDTVRICCGARHSMIMRSDGTLLTCGRNYYGQLGHNDTKDRYVFTQLKNQPKNIIHAACLESNSIIVSDNGLIMVCGEDHVSNIGMRTRFETVAKF